MSGLNELFLEHLGNMLHVENLLLKALPRMIEVSKSEELRDLLGDHFEETKRHLQRVQRSFKSVGVEPREKKCDSMLALLLEARRVGDRWKNSPALEVALICSAQKVEHFEIISYASLSLWAEELELKDVVKWLKETLEEERLADKQLGKLAEKLAKTESLALI